MKLMDGIVFTIEELDHFDTLNGLPFITSHEVCAKWGNGCKTSQDGYCFMAERNEE